ncbi:MAG TPA: glycosyltransferase 87 family protein [Gaiellaceae bacterium]|nr:glycosyltransferase 87 family protein [Gaiellaceae bacterium]
MRPAAAAIPIYLAACAVPDGGLFRAERFRDVHLYQGFAAAVFDGRVPYRDFFMEYPPGALVAFLPPAAFSHYNAAFKCLMAVCGVATLPLIASLLVRFGVSTTRLWVAMLLFALSPLALGPISLNTYDAWPALLTLAALALLLAERDVAAFALLGAAFAAKVYPVVLVPPAAIFVWRMRGRVSVLRGLAAFAAVVAVFLVPFLVLAPHGLAESFRAQAARSLQVESLFGSLLAVADRMGIYSATVVHRTGHAISYDLVGSQPEALAVLSSIAQALAVLSVAWLYLRGRDDPRRLALAFAAAIAGFLAFTRFFSPQYFVWLVPFVPLLEPAAWVLTAAALVLAQVWFFHYRDVFALGGYVWLVLVRDLLVVALFAFVFLRLRRLPPEDEDAVLLEHELPLRVPS